MADAWLNANALWKQVAFAQGLAARVARANISATRLLEKSRGPLASPATLQAVARAESPAQAMALAFASPEIQRR